MTIDRPGKATPNYPIDPLDRSKKTDMPPDPLESGK
jgi:hypothetical protein